MAQWITRSTSNAKIVGSTPIVGSFEAPRPMCVFTADELASKLMMRKFLQRDAAFIIAYGNECVPPVDVSRDTTQEDMVKSLVFHMINNGIYKIPNPIWNHVKKM